MLLQIGIIPMFQIQSLATIILNHMVSRKLLAHLTSSKYAGKGLPVLIADISVTDCTVTTPVIIEILKFTVITLVLIKVGKYYCDKVSCPKKYSANRCLSALGMETELSC